MSGENGRFWVGIIASFAAGLMAAYMTFGFTTGERLARLETKVDLLMEGYRAPPTPQTRVDSSAIPVR